jgi:hypothetical protein
MKVFDLPYSTEVNKVIPKNAFETYCNSKQKKQFTELIQKITWLNKLSDETTNLNSIEIKEIQIFHFELKSKQKIDSLITLVDRAIPYPIVFIISFENEYYISTSKKHNHPLNQDNAIIDWRFESEWILKDENKFNFNLKKNLDEVFFDFCNQLVNQGKHKLKTIDEVVEYDKNVSSISREIEKLTTAIKNCKQFNKKVELNIQLKRAQQKLSEVTQFN